MSGFSLLGRRGTLHCLVANELCKGLCGKALAKPTWATLQGDGDEFIRWNSRLGLHFGTWPHARARKRERRTHRTRWGQKGSQGLPGLAEIHPFHPLDSFTFCLSLSAWHLSLAGVLTSSTLLSGTCCEFLSAVTIPNQASTLSGPDSVCPDHVARATCKKDLAQ